MMIMQAVKLIFLIRSIDRMDKFGHHRIALSTRSESDNLF